MPRQAKACPKCGSDERTGWSVEARTDGLDLPDQEFDYEDFVEREFGGGNPAKPRGIGWLWWAVAIAVVVAFLGLVLSR